MSGCRRFGCGDDAIVAPGNGLDTRVVGTTMESRPEAIRSIANGPIVAEVVPARAHGVDPTAMEVHADGKMLGYLDKRLARFLWKQVMRDRLELRAVAKWFHHGSARKPCPGVGIYIYDPQGRDLGVPQHILDHLARRFAGEEEDAAASDAAADGGPVDERDPEPTSTAADYQEFARYNSETQKWVCPQASIVVEDETNHDKFVMSWPRAGMSRDGVAFARTEQPPAQPCPPEEPDSDKPSRPVRLDLRDKMAPNHSDYMHFDAEHGLLGNSYCVVTVDTYRQHGIMRNNKFNRELSERVASGYSGFRQHGDTGWGPLPLRYKQAMAWYMGTEPSDADGRRVLPAGTEPDFFDKHDLRVLIADDGAQVRVSERVIAPFIAAGDSMYAYWGPDGGAFVQAWAEDGDGRRLKASFIASRPISEVVPSALAPATTAAPVTRPDLLAGGTALPPETTPAEGDPLDAVCGTDDAAAIIGKSPKWTRELCEAGAIRAKRIGRAWVVDRHWLERHRDCAFRKSTPWRDYEPTDARPGGGES